MPWPELPPAHVILSVKPVKSSLMRGTHPIAPLETAPPLRYNAPMSLPSFLESDRENAGGLLAGLYAKTLLGYLFCLWLLWHFGVESIYQHPTPFYALPWPAFTSPAVPAAALSLILALYMAWRMRGGWATLRGTLLLTGALGLSLLLTASTLLRQVRAAAISEVLALNWSEFRWHALAVTVFAVSLALLAWALKKVQWFDREPGRRTAIWMLVGLVVFGILFPGAVAMIRDGVHGITQAYERHGYEYIDDIGKGRSIRAFLGSYNEIHPYLSMHAKVHPPGPVVILWLMSYVTGQSALGLSLGTMILGALGIVPLYLWAKDLLGRRAALTCCTLYALMPSIVLFTATCADITFMPFVLTTLFLFQRALDRNSVAYAAAAGVGYALLSLISFSLISLGAYFAFIGLWRLRDPDTRTAVLQTAIVMVLSAAALHLAVRLWSGFDILACFHLSKAQFDLDQIHLDELAPRFPVWTWKFLNPLSWFFFAGIPVSVLFLLRLARPEASSNTKNPFWAFALTLVALDILYLARGEGERSAMYILPFVVLPAGHLLNRIGEMTRSHAPLLVTAAFLGLQCWLIESFLYTYW